MFCTHNKQLYYYILIRITMVLGKLRVRVTFILYCYFLIRITMVLGIARVRVTHLSLLLYFNSYYNGARNSLGLGLRIFILSINILIGITMVLGIA